MADWWYSLKLNAIEILISERHYHGWWVVNTLRPNKMDAVFQTTFSNAFSWIKISLKIVPKGPINNIPTLVQIMAWHKPGDKPLSEPMVVSFLRHICITRSQWVNARSQGIITHWHNWTSITHMIFHIYHVHGTNSTNNASDYKCTI